jgi:hypothetical protein
LCGPFYKLMAARARTSRSAAALFVFPACSSQRRLGHAISRGKIRPDIDKRRAVQAVEIDVPFDAQHLDHTHCNGIGSVGAMAMEALPQYGKSNGLKLEIPSYDFAAALKAAAASGAQLVVLSSAAFAKRREQPPGVPATTAAACMEDRQASTVPPKATRAGNRCDVQA